MLTVCSQLSKVALFGGTQVAGIKHDARTPKLHVMLSSWFYMPHLRRQTCWLTCTHPLFCTQRTAISCLSGSILITSMYSKHMLEDTLLAISYFQCSTNRVIGPQNRNCLLSLCYWPARVAIRAVKSFTISGDLSTVATTWPLTLSLPSSVQNNVIMTLFLGACKKCDVREPNLAMAFSSLLTALRSYRYAIFASTFSSWWMR